MLVLIQSLVLKLQLRSSRYQKPLGRIKKKCCVLVGSNRSLMSNENSMKSDLNQNTCLDENETEMKSSIN